MAKLHALWWWIDRWRKSTAYTDMTLEEQGAYRNLLDEAHLRGGPLPTDERILAKACGDALAWPGVRDKVLAHFDKTPEGYRHPTLDEVYTKSQALSVARSAAGKAGNRIRWSRSQPPRTSVAHHVANPIATPLANGLASASSPSPSPSPSPDQSPEVRATRGSRRALHTAHVFCGRVCVPSVLHTDFIRLLNTPDAETQLAAWYEQVDQTWTTGAHAHDKVGTDVFLFWKARFNEWAEAPAVSTRPSVGAHNAAVVAARRRRLDA